ncbi:MAG: kinase [Pseudomonadota bacterium]|nr:kinase [Pseudomonadota bacterium]
MIISRTPVRITFLGGGTDYPEYFLRNGGETLGMAINKYSYVVVNPLPQFSNHQFRVSYQKIEHTNSLDDIKHPSVRECLRYSGISSGLEVHYTGDLPARTGLGSSSSFTVGLLNALYGYKGQRLGKDDLARDACQVEQTLIKERVGCQDEYTCSHGGLVNIHYSASGSVDVTTLRLPPDRFVNLQAHLMLFYTGLQRRAHDVIKEQLQKTNDGDLDDYLGEMKNMASAAVGILANHEKLEEFGELMHAGWQLKKKFSSAISNAYVEEMYNKARAAGAIGGKLLGAGSGGFMLFFVPPSRRERVFNALSGHGQVDFSCDEQGTQILFSN